jgi:DNA-binding transcriptional ArsR family regulator
MGIYYLVPRATAHSDPFAALAEPRRRELLRLVAGIGTAAADDGEDAVAARNVSWLVNETGWPQAQVSKHLGVLRKVGLLSATRKGRHRVYSLNGQQLRSVYDWIKTYERFWEHNLLRIKERAEQPPPDSLKPAPHTPAPSMPDRPAPLHPASISTPRNTKRPT